MQQRVDSPKQTAVASGAAAEDLEFPRSLSLLDPSTLQLVMVELKNAPKPHIFSPEELHGAEYRPVDREELRLVPLNPEKRLETAWDGLFLMGRFGNIPLTVVAFKGCPDHDSDTDLSAAYPAFNEVARDGKSVQVFLHKSIPTVLYDVVLFHELVENELYTYYGVPRDVAHAVSVIKTEQYVQNHCDPETQARYAEFNGRFSRAAA